MFKQQNGAVDVSNLHEVERLREEAEHEIGRSEVENQKISRSSHVSVCDDHVTHETVACRSERYKQRKDNNQRHLQQHTHTIMHHKSKTREWVTSG